jgi:hypothetical protein
MVKPFFKEVIRIAENFCEVCSCHNNIRYIAYTTDQFSVQAAMAGSSTIKYLSYKNGAGHTYDGK